MEIIYRNTYLSKELRSRLNAISATYTTATNNAANTANDYNAGFTHAIAAAGTFMGLEKNEQEAFLLNEIQCGLESIMAALNTVTKVNEVTNAYKTGFRDALNAIATSVGLTLDLILGEQKQ